MANEIPSIDPSALRLTAFRLQRLEDLNYPQPDTGKAEQPHRHNFQEIIWIESGSGLHEIDGKPLTIEPHTVYLIAQGQVHCFLEARGVNGYVLSFTDDFLSDGFTSAPRFHHALFNNVRTLSALRIDQRDTDSIEQLLKLLDDESQRPDNTHGEIVIQHLLQALLIKIERMLQEGTRDLETTGANLPLLSRFLVALEANYTQRHDVEFYARELATTRRQLSEAVKQQQGKTAKQLIEERVILEAKRNLRFTAQSVKEIAHSLGFDDPSYFSKVFRKHTALSPQDFKARNAS